MKKLLLSITLSLSALFLSACGADGAEKQTANVEETGVVHEVTIIGYAGKEVEDFRFEPEELAVKQGDKVRLTLESDDEIEHGLTIFGISKQLKQGETLEFIAEEPGEHIGQCSVFCGAGHAVMTFKLTVD
ncbi:cytochrome C oxidase subunit II [Bacillus lacus]|uniref:Cytochrome C oxidase subunit II n=1 Tax=Metabacillus lacus TaxID=1983721 RepID=A0A7X2LW66_9BACI|nr:cytochrome C oxidase subunit II [Metabacillus lacus]MRX71150.1 cytochrome C oxidase subunit II [Metabacillus lacus]